MENSSKEAAINNRFFNTMKKHYNQLLSPIYCKH